MSIIPTHKAGETFVCDCGNTPDSDGFFPCDEAGRIIEPTADSDWDGLYVCERCGQLHREEEVVA
jgi:hypothetical protein